MKSDIILAGVGGQGILSIANVIGEAALNDGLNIKQAEVHGMSQRGGDVQSNLRISSEAISSDLIPKGKADIVIALEPMEALRYVEYLAPEGWIITNSAPFINIPDYPAIEDVMAELKKLPRVIILDIDEIAKDAGIARAGNIVLLGAASEYVGIEYDKLEAGIRRIFGRKGEAVVDMNLLALRLGRENAKK